MYRLASRVTVFRDSQYIGTYDVDGITNADLIKAMVGREIKDLFPKPEVKLGDEMLKVENLSRTGYFKDVSFKVRAGEILGLTGLVGAGRTETVEAVCGITQPDSGKVYLEGKEVHIKNRPMQWKRYHSSSGRPSERRSDHELGTGKKRNTSYHQQICEEWYQ